MKTGSRTSLEADIRTPFKTAGAAAVLPPQQHQQARRSEEDRPSSHAQHDFDRGAVGGRHRYSHGSPQDERGQNHARGGPAPPFGNVRLRGHIGQRASETGPDPAPGEGVSAARLSG
jgi:hypothetical protein